MPEVDVHDPSPDVDTGSTATGIVLAIAWLLVGAAVIAALVTG